MSFDGRLKRMHFYVGSWTISMDVESHRNGTGLCDNRKTIVFLFPIVISFFALYV